MRWQNDKKVVVHKTEMGIHKAVEKNKATAINNDVVRCRMTDINPNYQFFCEQIDRQRWLIDNAKKLTEEERIKLWDNVRNKLMADVELDELYYSVKKRMVAE